VTYGFTKSTPLDRCYRFAPRLSMSAADEGAAAVYRFHASRPLRPMYLGVVVAGQLVRPFAAPR
jgi:hypothetical protein